MQTTDLQAVANTLETAELSSDGHPSSGDKARGRLLQSRSDTPTGPYMS
ncbi:hypothetical protein [Segatella baroniae]|nr:hypothetical protein [Segatella baroniae]